MDTRQSDRLLFIESPPLWKGFHYTNCYSKRFLAETLFRSLGLISLLASLYIFNEVLYKGASNDYLFPAIMILLGAIICFIGGEYDYVVYGPTARPIKIFSNGILLPPLYIQHLKKDKGLIYKSSIISYKIIRTEYYSIPDSDNIETVWRNGPVRIEMLLTNGKVKRTSIKPPTVIMAIAKILKEDWGIPVVDEGEGTGTVERVVDGKVFDTRRI